MQYAQSKRLDPQPSRTKGKKYLDERVTFSFSAPCYFITSNECQLSLSSFESSAN